MSTKKAFLFDGDDVSEKELNDIHIDEKYAKKFEERKRREALKTVAQHLQASDNVSDDSSSSEEDSDAELLTKEVQAKVLTTISRIRKKDASIYDPQTFFFDENDFNSQVESKRSYQPLTFSKFMSQTLTKDGPTAFCDDEEALKRKRPTINKASTFEKEQRALKQEFLDAANRADNSDGDWLQKSSKTAEDLQREEISFREFLHNRAKTNPDESTLLEHYLRDDEELDANQKFLRDYVLYEGWKEGNEMPQGDINQDTGDKLDRIHPDEEEKYLQDANQFEALYNFRYEEQPSSTIQGHARKVYDSVRQKEQKRRLLREEKKERKAREKEEKKTELELLKRLKKEEILDRLKTIQRIVGGPVRLDAEGINFDKEFNDEDHERHMKTLLGENFDEQTEDNPDEIEATAAEFNALIGETSLSKKPLSAKQKRTLHRLEKKMKKQQDYMHNDEPYAPLPEGVDPTEYSTFGEQGDQPIPEHDRGNEQTTDQERAHLWYLCDGCHFGIPAGHKRYECSQCEDYILCKACFQSIRHPHTLTPHRVPSDCKPPAEMVCSGTQTAVKPTVPLPEEVEKALEEYYSLNYEDIVGGIPVRFKYTATPKNDFGLSTMQILDHTDAELNQKLSLKKLAPFQKECRPQKWKPTKHRSDTNLATKAVQHQPHHKRHTTKVKCTPSTVSSADPVGSSGMTSARLQPSRLAAYGL